MGENFTSENITSTPTHSSRESAFDHYGMTTAEVLFVTVLSIGISVIGTISNILVIVSIARNRRLRAIHTALLLVNFSSFDLMICAVYVPMHTIDINYGSSATLHAVRFKLGFGLFLGSLNSAFAVSFDRLISIYFPFRYVEWMTGKLIGIVIFFTWFIATGLTAISLAVHPPIYCVIYIAVVVTLIISFHIAMYRVARRSAFQVTGMKPTRNHRFPIWNKSATLVAILMLVSLVCWAPLLISSVVIPHSSPLYLRVHKIVLGFTSLTSAINPFIFCWRLAEFREAICSNLCEAKAVIHPKRDGDL